MMADLNAEKRPKQNKDSVVVDDDDDDEDSRVTTQRKPLDVVFDGEVLLSEALPFLDTTSIVDKKMVCRQWEEKCNAAINSKGRRVKKRFDGKRQLRDAVDKYCKGNREEMESVVEEYGYPIGKWDVSQVEDFSYVFCDRESFNEDIGAWDVGNGTNMGKMFFGATSFNQSLSGWDVSNVKNMRGMFGYARAFNGDVSSWDTSKATYMGYMFYYASAFNEDISGWNVSRVTEMQGMFAPKDEDRFDRDRLDLIKANWEKQGKRWW